MADYNPYEAPKAAVGPAARSNWSYVSASAGGIAAVIANLSVPVMYELTRTGVMHPVPFLCMILTAVLAVVGAVLVLFRKRAAIAVFGVALVSAIGSVAMWRSGGLIALAVFVAIAFGAALRR